jgi:alpha-beta hydrolase superfamily lysophospholipase
MMQHSNFNFSSNDGLSLFGRVWMSLAHHAKGIVNIVHGLGEHSGRYAHVAEALTEAGYHVVGFDLRGHGLSEGRRGHSPDFDHLLDDIAIFLEKSRELFNEHLPAFLYGHSLGGSLVINYSLQRSPDLAGVIATDPSLVLSFEPPKYKLMLGKVMAKLLPSFSMNNALDVNALSRDKAVVKAYQDDVYVHDRISARLAMDLIDTGQYAMDHAEEWSLPLLLMHGTADGISSCDASQRFSEIAGGNVDLVLWEDYYHEIHNDIGKEKVIVKMISWLDEKANS